MRRGLVNRKYSVQMFTKSSDCLSGVAEFGRTVHRRRNRGGGGSGPLTFLFEGAQYDRGPLTFEKCRPIFELKVTPYFQS